MRQVVDETDSDFLAADSNTNYGGIYSYAVIVHKWNKTCFKDINMFIIRYMIGLKRKDLEAWNGI